MPDRGTSAAQDAPPRRGRAAARSRLGCSTCKRRHVRCDESYPVCSHCSRLQLQCHYLQRPRGYNKSGRTPTAAESQRKLLPLPTPSGPLTASNDTPSPSTSANTHNEEGGPFTLTADHMAQFMSLPWFDEAMSGGGGAHLGREVPDLGISWTGEFGRLMEHETAPSLDAASQEDLGSLPCIELDQGPGDLPTPISSTVRTLPNSAASDMGPSAPSQASVTRTNGNTCVDTSPQDSRDVFRSRPPSRQGQCSNDLAMFGNIMQPPAAMLMGGIRRWRHLQRYLLGLGTKNNAVMNALLCLEEVLARDDDPEGSGLDGSASRITERYEAAKNQVLQRTAQKDDLEEQEMNELLAAVFLLAWIQVIRDRGAERSESTFPSDQADVIISSCCSWNWYSRQLLSWFNSLDSKATHLGGPPLLSPEALGIVSRYPIQIVSCNYEELKERQKSLDGQESFKTMSAGSVTDVSEHGDSATVVPALTTVDVKEIVLRAILQPAAEWYLQTQAYFRHIGSLDKHHRSRFTPDDELEVALVGKQFSTELWDLWAQRPSAISLTAADLSRTMAPDMATRLEEVFSVYLASYWILFVYLHRVCWWHLAHTPTVRGAMDETWELLHRSYGERDDCGQYKAVHPALMWPVFVFGAECSDGPRRAWAVEQIKGLAKPRPVLEMENGKLDTLPAFRLSRGATKNAKRAALLLEALIKKQGETGARVDDRDLAMEMFGCHFSIV